MKRNEKGEWSHTTPEGDASGLSFVPERRITELRAEFNYRPCRGISASLAVEDSDGTCIGWVDIRDLGYFDVREWMRAVKHPEVQR